jgi:serine/threonine-protein kinase
MSPEQAQGENVDARTDQFALGIVFWELLTMRRLFKRETESQTLDAIVEGNIPRPRRFREDVPSSIEDVVMTALARDKHKRFRDCEEMALALEDALAKESIVHSPSRLSQYMRRLFADQIAEEASLGVVAPDGSISVRNTFPLHERRPDPEAARVEPKRPSIADADDAPPRKEVTAPDEDAAPVDQTQADRRRGRSRSAEAEREPAPRKDRVTKEPTKEPTKEQTKEQTKDAIREPTKAPTKSAAPEPAKDREPTRSRSRADLAPSVSAPPPRRAPVLLVGGAVAAVVCVVVVVALLALGDGPANLIVRTEPRGARVVVDGRDTQQASPALLRDVRSGEPHKVHVELPGYLPLDEIVTIPRKGITHEVRFDLTPVR